MRELGARPLGGHWDLAILMSLIIDLQNQNLVNELDGPVALAIFRKYENFVGSIHAHSLQNSYDTKHILDGKTVSKLLDIKPGPQVGLILQSLLEWQLGEVNPTVEEAKSWVIHHFQRP